MLEIKVTKNTKTEKAYTCGNWKISMSKDSNSIRFMIYDQEQTREYCHFLYFKSYEGFYTARNSNSIRSMIEGCNSKNSWLKEQAAIMSGIGYGFDIEAIFKYNDFYESTDQLQIISKKLYLTKDSCEELFSLFTYPEVKNTLEKLLKGEEPWV